MTAIGRPTDGEAIRQLCCYDGDGPFCGRPAVTHVWIRDDFATMTCEEHSAWWDIHEHEDQHPMVTACGLPGTTWMFGEPGRCVLDEFIAEAVGAEAVGESVSA